VLGRTDSLAWGFTNTGLDVQDVSSRRSTPTTRALSGARLAPFVTEPMAITVRAPA
jgi:acyl-homoserine lactone acylase PvdQ